MSNASEPKKAVVDINLFVSGLISSIGLPNRLVAQLRQDLFILIISEQLRAELEEVLQRNKFRTKYGLTKREVLEFLLLVDTKAIMVKPKLRLPVIVRDPKDEIVLATALGGQADYLVTGDRDLLDLDRDTKIGTLRIITAREFLEVLENTN